MEDPSRIDEDAIWVAVDARSEDAAWGEIVRARTEQPRETSRVLAQVFEQAHSRPLEVVVGGPYPKLTDQVLRDAFGLAHGELEGLRLVEVGAEPLSEELLALCRERGAECLHQLWTPRSD